LDKIEDINNEDDPFDSIDSNTIQEESANQEFKRRLCKQIPKQDKIWSDGDKFDIEKLTKEPYLSIVNKKASNAKTVNLILSHILSFFETFNHFSGYI
jgi:hypothetical protein